MKIELTQTPLLTTQQIGELASTLDLIHSRVEKTIERLNKDVSAKKSEIASRWKSSYGLSSSDLARMAKNETLAVIRLIKDNAKDELDKLLKDAGKPHADLVAQRVFYDSPVKVLSRAALGDSRRTEYLQQLTHAGPAELGHMAQVAVSTKNVQLAAAVLSLLDRLPTKDRPVGPTNLATAMNLADFEKVHEYIKLGDLRLQGILVNIRTWTTGKSNPINTIQLAMRNSEINHDLTGGHDDD